MIKDKAKFISFLEENKDELVLNLKKAHFSSLSSVTAVEVADLAEKHGFLINESSNITDGEINFILEKARPSAIGNNMFCMGCSACANVCPSDALNIQMNKDGFYKPTLHEKNCIKCNLCVKGCPAIGLPESSNTKTPKTYELIANDDDLLFASASGGAFGLLANNILKDNGVVFGVAWREDFSAGHISINKKSDLHLLQKSKYLQSYIGKEVYRNLKRSLDEGKRVLFSGSPCHVHGLNNYLGDHSYSNLLTVDILCAQAPSTKIFQKYLADTFGENNVKDYTFRSKVNGWNHCATTTTTTTTTVNGVTGTSFYGDTNNDSYQRVYHSGYIKPEHCAFCKYSELSRPADITIGDFWWVSKKDDDLHPEHKKGLSVVLANNINGEKAIDSTKPDTKVLKEVPLDWVGPNGGLFKRRCGDMGNLQKRKDFKKFYEIGQGDKHEV